MEEQSRGQRLATAQPHWFQDKRCDVVDYIGLVRVHAAVLLQGSENQPGCSLLRVPRWSHATIQPSRLRPHHIAGFFSSPGRVASARNLSAVDRLAARLYCEQTTNCYSSHKHNVPPLAPLVRPGIACPDPQTRHVLVWPGSTSQSVPFFGGSTDVWPRRTGTGRVGTPGLLAECAHKNSPISTPSRSSDAQMQLPTCSIHHVSYTS
ncbi:uncharacterized protein TrAtP1_007377 [Trichoderma atroviride]|uniref:uncharacterized protein n=1 Tax=Hypocrea atroviridis TaxID=63577 RepID=UPI0033228671|nr:hypothetical protein TrAtP1_007377 [Trichoderma atroviride]